MSKKTKSESNWNLLIIFIILMGFVFALPAIKNYFRNKNIDDIKDNVSKETKKNNVDEEENNNNAIYDYSENLEIVNQQAKISDIRFEVNTLKLKFYNLRESALYLDNDNYYLEFYNGNQKFLKRVKINYNKLITPNGFILWETKLPSEVVNNFKKIALVKMTDADYPYVELKTVEDVKTLTCTKEANTYTYLFDDNSNLKTINGRNIYSSTNEDYASKKLTTKEDAVNKDLIEGISASFQEDINGYTYYIRYDLKSLPGDFKYSDYLYRDNTSVRVINFEMESLGFNCE